MSGVSLMSGMSGSGMSGASSAAPSMMDFQTDAWKQFSVAGFLSQVNWSNQVQDSEPSPQHPSTPVMELHYQLSVGQFFAAIPWNGELKTESEEADLQLPVMDEGASSLPAGESLPLELPDLDEFADSAVDAGEDLTLDDFFDSFSDF